MLKCSILSNKSKAVFVLNASKFLKKSIFLKLLFTKCSMNKKKKGKLLKVQGIFYKLLISRQKLKNSKSWTSKKGHFFMPFFGEFTNPTLELEKVFFFRKSPKMWTFLKVRNFWTNFKKVFSFFEPKKCQKWEFKCKYWLRKNKKYLEWNKIEEYLLWCCLSFVYAV